MDRLDLRRYLCRALEHWSRAGRLTSSLVKDVCTHTAGNKERAEVCGCGCGWWVGVGGIRCDCGGVWLCMSVRRECVDV